MLRIQRGSGDNIVDHVIGRGSRRQEDAASHIFRRRLNRKTDRHLICDLSDAMQ